MNHDFNWIRSIILSCNNEFQLDAGRVLIDLFEAKHSKENAEALRESVGDLLLALEERKVFLSVNA